MSHELIQTRWMSSPADSPNIDSAGGEVYFQRPHAFYVHRVALIPSTAVDPDNSVALDINIYRNPTALSETGRVLIGTWRVMAAAATNLAVGHTAYKDLHVDDADGETAEDGNRRNVAPEAIFSTHATTPAAIGSELKNLIRVGESLQLELASNAEADSGAVVTWVEYTELGSDPAFWGVSGTALGITKDVTQDISQNPSARD